MAKKADDDRERRKAAERLLLRRGGSATWYVLRVASQKELAVEKLLVRRGLMAYVPRAYNWRQRSRYAKGKKILVKRALMQRYVFVGFIDEPRWFELMRLPVIDDVLGIDGCPSELRWTAVDAMIRRYHGGVEPPREYRHMRSNKEYKIDDVVRIVDGPFRENLVRVDDIRGRHASVMVDFLGGIQSFKIPLDKLEPA